MSTESTLTIRLDESLKAQFTEAAKRSDRTAAQLLRDFMREFVGTQGKQVPMPSAAQTYDEWLQQAVAKGMASADAGRLTSHADVKAMFAAKRAAWALHLAAQSTPALNDSSPDAQPALDR
jgi:predicted transcriptional regulator